MNLPGLYVAHIGADPVWHGGPSQRMIQAIKSFTRSREDTGRRFYVTIDGWKPLNNPRAFEELNAMLDAVRRAEALWL